MTAAMEMSAQVDMLMPAFVSAFAEVDAVTKTQTAKVATKQGGEYKYSYADIGVALEQLRPALAKHRLAVTQPPATEWRDGASFVRVETWLVHESGQWMRSTLELRPSGSDPQSIGSAITYARRYALLAMLGVATEDDDGQRASRPQRHSAPAPDPIAVEMAAEEFDRLRGLGEHGPAFMAWLGERAPGHPRVTVPAMLEVDGWRAKLAGYLDEFERDQPVVQDAASPEVADDAPAAIRPLGLKDRIEALPADAKEELRDWALRDHGIRNTLFPKKNEEPFLLAWLNEHAPQSDPMDDVAQGEVNDRAS